MWSHVTDESAFFPHRSVIKSNLKLSLQKKFLRKNNGQTKFK